MPNYISYPIDIDPAVLLEEAYDYIQTRSPAWEPHDGNLDVWLLQVLATQASDLRFLAKDVPDTIFRYFGNTILGIPPNIAVSARVQAQFIAIDLLGHLIPAGSLVGIRDNSGNLHGFRTEVDYTIWPGLSETREDEVTLVAVEPGEASTNIGGSGVEAEIIDSFDFLDSVVLFDLTAGGVDAESIDDYTNRLAEYMRGLSTRPILAEDYARLAMNQPGVYRALAIDGYDPTNDTYFNEKMITVIGVDQFGLDLPDEVKTDLDTMLQGMREINFIVNVIDPSRTIIDVQFEGVAIPGYNTATVEAEATANVIYYLSPMNWAKDKTSSGDASRTWVDQQFVYYNEVMRVLSATTGMDHITNLLINRNTDSPNVNDIALDLPAALTEPGVVDGTVT
jgi:hypothetical protein